jgi:Ala-tRNA(Pro) deacylase
LPDGGSAGASDQLLERRSVHALFVAVAFGVRFLSKKLLIPASPFGRANWMTPCLPSPHERESVLYDRFRDLGIAWKTYEHVPVFTVEQSTQVALDFPGGHTKNLFLKDKKGGLWLVVVEAHRRVDLPALAKQLHAPRYSFGSAELLIATLGIEPGSVTPFALMNDKTCHVKPVLDADLLKSDPVNFHPLRNDRTTAIAAADLVRFVKSCGHDPLVVTIPEIAS